MRIRAAARRDHVLAEPLGPGGVRELVDAGAQGALDLSLPLRVRGDRQIGGVSGVAEPPQRGVAEGWARPPRSATP